MAPEIELEYVASWIGNKLTTYGRISVTQTKEKYGTVRVYCGLGTMSLHSFLFPRYVYKHRHFPHWLWRLDITVSYSRLGQWLLSPWYYYHKLVYKFVYRMALATWPQHKDAILSGASYRDLI